MSFTSWLRNLRSALVPGQMGHKHRRRTLRTAAHRPRLERLEDRCVPALYAVTDLGGFGGQSVYAADLNEAGQVVGAIGGLNHAFLWNGTLIDLGTLGGGSSAASAINDLGQVVGSAELPDWTTHAFLINPQGGAWFQDSDLDGRNDFMMDLGILRESIYSGTYATDINNAGQVTGGAWDYDLVSGYHYSAFLWDAANGMTDLGVPLGFTDSDATGINETGQVTGNASYYDPLSGTHSSAFLWDATNGMTALGAGPSYTDSHATALNDAGQVVGYQWDASAPIIDPAFLWTPDSPNGLTGSFTDLGMLPGAIASRATAINNSGQVVGSSSVSDFDSHAFLWDAVGGMVDLQNQILSDPADGNNLQSAEAINDGGSIAVIGNSYWAWGDTSFFLTPGMPSISITDAPAVTEGNTGTVDATFTVTLAEAHDQIVTVDFTTVAGSADAGSDFVPTAGTLTFLPGETSKPITVPVKSDLLNEDTEYFTVNLSNPTNAFINVGQGTGTIVDDDPMPTLAVNDVQVTEGNSGTSGAVFTVSLSAPSGRWVSVYYSTANGTATAGSDYQVQSGWLIVAPGQLSQTITVLVNGDTLHETDETFSVNLSSPANATLADAQGVGTILNDDPVTLAISDVTLNEGNSGTTNFVFTVSLSAVSGQPVTVRYSTANGSATAGSDYVAAAGTLTIPAGQLSGTIIVQVNGDRLAEPNETFFINLSNPVNAGIADGQGVGTIVDDEPRISISDVTKAEGKKGQTTLFTFTITLSAAYDQAVTMSFRTVDGTATTSDSDYVAKTGTLTFAPGETTKTITIEVKGDSKQEANGTFYLDLFDNSSNALFTRNRGIGTILNDD